MSLLNLVVDPPPSFQKHIHAEQFLAWAKQDIKGGGIRNAINALSNVKRALHARIDNVLWALRVQHSADWPDRPRVEDKFKVLKRVGISTTAIVKVVTKRRNSVEHKYVAPYLDDVRSDVESSEMWLNESGKYPRNRIVIASLPCTLFSISLSAKTHRKTVKAEFKSPTGVVLFFLDAKQELVKVNADGSTSKHTFDSFNWRSLVDQQKKFLSDTSLVPRSMVRQIFRSYEGWVNNGTPSSIKRSTRLDTD